ncbi:MAG: hypothetical protein PHE83_11180 [Opitutaceae bacterium]|nr:hypothetical protein [Opitutaceae bacterium]
MNALRPVAAAARPPSRERCRHGRFNQSPRGFTILEVVLATFVMLFGIVSALTTLHASFQAIDNARYTTLAGQILQSQMEKLRLLTWAQLTDPTYGPGNYPNFTPDISASTTGQLSRFTSFTQTISDAPSPFNATMKDITLMVTWTDSFGSQHSLSYLTRYGQNGISDFFYTTH